MIKFNLSSIFLLFFVISISAQDYNFSIAEIPKNLLENANAIVRFDDISVEIHSQRRMTKTVKSAVTVLNKLGDNNRYVRVGFDKNTKIQRIKTVVYDASGKVIKKVKSKDYEDRSAVDGGTLYADNRVLYYRYVPTVYPYTIHYEYEIETSDTGGTQNWRPLSSYVTSVSKSTFAVNFPEDIVPIVKEVNFDSYDVIKENKENSISYSINSIESIKYEPLSPSLKEMLPEVKLTLDKFNIGGITGVANNWEDLGKWEYKNFYQNMQDLSIATKNKILQLVEGVEDPIEKAKIIFKYVQNKTRYVSVQVGIGGFRPMMASKVDELGYGDCKALSNYAKALLDVVGVNSYFTELYGSNEKLNMDFEFPSIHGNHVILNIPTETGDIWMDCTSQKKPFGFIANFTDDRDVIVVKEDGGVLKHTKIYHTEENIQATKGVYSVDVYGAIKAHLKITSKGTQYSTHLGVDGASPKELDIAFKKYFSSINNIKFSQLEVFNNRDEAAFEEKIVFTADNYATISGNEMLIPVNAFSKNTYVPKRIRNRKLPFEIARGYVDLDEVEISFPSELTLMYLPKDISLETKFGVYETTIKKIDDSTYSYKRKLQIEPGKYPKEAYEAYRSFRKSIQKYDNSKIVLSSKEI